MPVDVKVGFFVDVSNLYYCANHRFGRKLDYGKLLDLVTKMTGNTPTAVAYGYQVDHESSGFIARLRRAGYVTKYKKPRSVSGTVTKADWDVGIAMDVARTVGDYNLIILGTADGDMAPVVEYIQEKGVDCVVIGCNISKALRNITTCIEITEDCLV